MTRFARAKGSKASNERVPEEATSWAEMKEQLALKNKEIENAKKREEFMKQRNANYKAFLDEKASLENKKSEWSHFPNANKTKQNVNKSINSLSKKNRSAPDNSTVKDQVSSDDEAFKDLKCKVDKVLNDIELEDPLKEEGVQISILEPAVKVKKAKNKKRKSITTKLENGPKSEDEIIGQQKYFREKLSENNNTSSNNLKRKFDHAYKNTYIEKSDSDAPPDEESAKNEILVPTVKVKKIKKKKLQLSLKTEVKVKEQDDHGNLAADVNSKLQKKSLVKIDEDENRKKEAKNDQTVYGKKSSKDGKIKKKIKKSNLSTGEKPKKIIKKDLTEQDLKKIEKKKQKRIKQLEKKKKLKEELKLKKLAAEENPEEQVDSSKNIPENTSGKEIIVHSNVIENSYPKSPKQFKKIGKQIPKVRDKEDHKRKKAYLPHKMFINGKELEIDYVEGFPVKKEDAERLKKLRKEMIAKGLPGSEIKFALKLERRRAEKAFTREKKKVCFNCRKSGHNLSECPELGKDELAQTQGSGICFKCGSTEHTHFECKVVRGQEFNYAQCFICNEQGHIARQCPDNARGLYPKGGSCNVCGDVTHLKKDCPKYQAQQQHLGNSVQIETFGDGNPDNLEEKTRSVNLPVNRIQSKIIKF